MAAELFTVGYQGASTAALTRALRLAGVSVLADVRAVAWSRRREFAKAALRRELADVEIDYRHFPALGNPKAGRDAARAGRLSAHHEIYAAQLATPEAAAALDLLAELAPRFRVCLMCMERDPNDCHRAIARLLPRLCSARCLAESFTSSPSLSRASGNGSSAKV